MSRAGHPSKQMSVDAAAALIEDGRTVATGGFCGAAHPEALGAALERRFRREGTPRDLTLVYGAGQGDKGDRGLNHFGHAGLVRRVIGGHWRMVPRLGKLALDGEIEAVNFPQGVVCQLLREIAAGRPGLVTKVGLGTFIDPDHDGGRLNDRSPGDLVERIELGGETYLWYKAFPIHVALIRGTSADPHGGITFEAEGVKADALALATAARNHGGIVIAQVKRIRDRPAPPHEVVVPGALVDHVVVADPAEHEQTYADPMDPRLCSPAVAEPSEADDEPERLPLTVRRVIAARACDELEEGAVANLGIGLPEGIAMIADERGILDKLTLTVESGVFGGRPSSGLAFGTSRYPQAIIDQPSMFDFYDGGGLDFAALGAAQVDSRGRVNVSRFASVVAGVGGFVNITQNARRLVFCGTFTAGGLDVVVEDGKLVIRREGKVRKFLEAVEQVSFDPAFARAKEVLYVTERAVFRLAGGELELVEVAPGIDVERDVVGQMGFVPKMGEVREMPGGCFGGSQGN